MEQSAHDDEECGICLDALKNPVALPCRHKFCSECLNGWRSKYGADKMEEMDRKCPLCRQKIPPSKEMINQLKCMRRVKSRMEARGDVYSENYAWTKSRLEQLECAIGDWTETIDYSDSTEQCLVIPNNVFNAARANDIQKILKHEKPIL